MLRWGHVYRRIPAKIHRLLRWSTKMPRGKRQRFYINLSDQSRSNTSRFHCRHPTNVEILLLFWTWQIVWCCRVGEKRYRSSRSSRGQKYCPLCRKAVCSKCRRLFQLYRKNRGSHSRNHATSFFPGTCNIVPLATPSPVLATDSYVDTTASYVDTTASYANTTAGPETVIESINQWLFIVIGGAVVLIGVIIVIVVVIMQRKGLQTPAWMTEVPSNFTSQTTEERIAHSQGVVPYADVNRNAH